MSDANSTDASASASAAAAAASASEAAYEDYLLDIYYKYSWVCRLQLNFILFPRRRRSSPPLCSRKVMHADASRLAISSRPLLHLRQRRLLGGRGEHLLALVGMAPSASSPQGSPHPGTKKGQRRHRKGLGPATGQERMAQPPRGHPHRVPHRRPPLAHPPRQHDHGRALPDRRVHGDSLRAQLHQQYAAICFP